MHHLCSTSMIMAPQNMKNLFRTLLLFVTIYNTQCTILNSTMEWKAIQDTRFRLSGRNLDFPCDATASIYKESSKYIPSNILISRMQIFLYDVIVAMPRYKQGIPITLGKVSLKCNGCNPAIKPFPDWHSQQEGNCDSIQSAVDIYLDRNSVLWVLDDGVIDSLESPYKKCAPKVIAINMLTNKIKYTIDLSPYVKPESNLQYIVAETAESGDNYIYVADSQTGAIIMVNADKGHGKRLAFPPSVKNVCPKSCVLFMTIIMKADYKNYLFFTYVDCPLIFSVETSTIRDEDGLGSIVVIGKKPEGSGIVFCGTDNLSNLFFRRVEDNTMYTWDSNTAWKKDHWLMVNRGSLERQVTHTAPGPWKLMWLLESNVGDYIAQKTGCVGPSTILQPIAKGHNDNLNSIASRLLRNRL